MLGAIVGPDRPGWRRRDVLAHRRTRARAAARRGRGDDQRRDGASHTAWRSWPGWRARSRPGTRCSTSPPAQSAASPIGLAVGWMGTQVISPPDRRRAEHLRSRCSSPTAAYIAAEELDASASWRPSPPGSTPAERALVHGRRHAPLRHRVLGESWCSGSRRCCSCCSGCRLRSSRTSSTSDSGLACRRSPVALTVVAVRMAWAGYRRPASRGVARAGRGRLGGDAGRDLARRGADRTARVEERPEILLITFGVISVTLLGQGLTLRRLARVAPAHVERCRPTRRVPSSRPPRPRSTGSRSSRRRAPTASRCSACASSTGRASRLHGRARARRRATTDGGSSTTGRCGAISSGSSGARWLCATKAASATTSCAGSSATSTSRSRACGRGRFPRLWRSTAEGAWGFGLATLCRAGLACSTRCSRPALGAGARPGRGRATSGRAMRPRELAAAAGPDERRGVRTVAVRTVVGSLADPPADAHDAYLRLHLLSHRLVAPARGRPGRGLRRAPEHRWTSRGPVDPAASPRPVALPRRAASRSR